MNNYNDENINQSSFILRNFISSFASESLMIKLVNVSLYPSDFGNISPNQSTNVVGYIIDFLTDLCKVSKKLNIPNYKAIYDQVDTIKSILNIRDSGTIAIKYDNINQHLPNLSFHSTKIIKEAIINQISNIEQFRNETNDIFSTINAFYEVNQIRQSLHDQSMFFAKMSQGNMSPIEAIKEYKDITINTYNNLDKLKSVNSEQVDDCIVIGKEGSEKHWADKLFKYIEVGYSTYKTGYELFDNVVEGIESSSVHLITAPSNHGKSLFMVNMCRNMITTNLDSFEPNDAILFYTLEDDIYKLSRRFISTFGNYKYSVIKRMFENFKYTCHADKSIGSCTSDLAPKMKKMLQNVAKSSMSNVIKNKVSLIIQHYNENTFSASTLANLIERKKLEGYNIKMVFLDYVDVMVSSMNKYQNNDDYNVQGQIVQELRNVSRNKQVPIITATQNRRESENENITMGNSLIGDSYKKVRYADFVYMARMRRQSDMFSDSQIRASVLGEEDESKIDKNILRQKDDLLNKLIPFEVKITKAKESGKDITKFFLFSNDTLRIYNNINEYLIDQPTIQRKSDSLENDIAKLINYTHQGITAPNIISNEIESEDLQNIFELGNIPDFLSASG